MSLVTDIRLAARLLLKDRTFSVAAVSALALGIAATNTVFALLNGVFIRPLPFEEPDRVVAISTRALSGDRESVNDMSYPDIVDLRAAARTFVDIAAVDQTVANLTDADRAPERFTGAYITANGFSLIGRRPALGRDFTADDDRPGAAPVVILGDGVWRSRYGGRPDILGTTIRVNRVASTVIGVMPPRFGFPTNAELWLPMSALKTGAMSERGTRFIVTFGRLAPGVTFEQATADLDTIMARLAAAYPATNRGVASLVRPFRDLNTSGPLRTAFALLATTVVLLLLIACANVANLLLARGVTRAREISLRLSIGATRAQIVRQLLAESLVLAAVSGLAGVALAAVGVRLFHAAVRGTGEPYWLEFPLDARVLAVFVAIGSGTVLIFGLLPALRTSSVSLLETLSDAGRGAVGSRRTQRWTGSLVTVQLALTMILLSAAGLTARNTAVQRAVGVGVDTTGLLRLQLALPPAVYDTIEKRAEFYRRLDQELVGLPGVRAGVGQSPRGGALIRAVSVDGHPVADAARVRTSNVFVGEGYFRALGLSPQRGRVFRDADNGQGANVAVVNERFAAQHFPNVDAVGQRISLSQVGTVAPDSGWVTIVGVVANVRYAESDARVIEPVVYLPAASLAGSSPMVIARSSSDVAAAARTVRAAVARIDPDLAVFDVMTVDEAIDSEGDVQRVFVAFFGIFAVLALVLASVGLYGVTAYALVQRTREIGVRVALGARRSHVWWLVTRRAAVQLTIGLAVGIAGALAMGQLMQGIVSSVDTSDPFGYVGIALVLIVVSLGACLPPVRRAVRLNPVEALRAE
jgi:putative ABC transport system permease protein